ncbi:YkvA family protein [Qipengyuania sphaerica]|uniref:YkvA family protein n=1 Tax=Qipengyuania sphaerica TaxID=2867243 RepID=UPI0031F065AB
MAKLLAGAVAAYALSPIDLIPDFIPVLGLLDDLLIVPAGIWSVLKLVPKDLMSDFREQAAKLAAQPQSSVGLLFVLAIWLSLAALIGLFLIR